MLHPYLFLESKLPCELSYLLQTALNLLGVTGSLEYHCILFQNPSYLLEALLPVSEGVPGVLCCQTKARSAVTHLSLGCQR